MKEFSGQLRKKANESRGYPDIREIPLKRLINLYMRIKKIIYIPPKFGINHGKGRY